MKMMKINNTPDQQRLMLALALAGLACLLFYTFKHTGGLLAQYVRPWPFGYIAAFGIEITIAGMSFRLATATKRKPFLMFVLITALVVSAMANIAEGYRAYYGEPLTVANIGRIDLVQALVGLSATGLISLLVFAISEIVGKDVNTVTEDKRKAERKQATATVRGEQPEQTGRTDYKQLIYDKLNQGKHLGPRPMADAVNCSPATAKKWIDAFALEHGQVDPADMPIFPGGKDGNKNGKVK